MSLQTTYGATIRVYPGLLMGKNCMLCRKSITKGGSFVICPHCYNIYCLECAKQIKICINCGHSLDDAIATANKLRGVT